MLIPQYSLRLLLGITTGCAVVFSIFAVALRGNMVAAAVSIAILSLVIVALVQAGLFAAVWMLAAVASLVSPNRFAANSPPGDIDAAAPTPTEGAG